MDVHPAVRCGLVHACSERRPGHRNSEGTVTDTSGANIPGAKITLSEPSTGRVVRQGTSSSTGVYEFDELQPSTYVLHCDAQGFKSFEAQDIVLDPGRFAAWIPSWRSARPVRQ